MGTSSVHKLNIEQLLARLKKDKFVVLGEDELKALLDKVMVLKEEDTFFSGYIRIFQIDNIFLVQEQSLKAEIILRITSSQEEAEQFLNNRLLIYEKMWDGCGCKINYYQ